MKERNKKKHEVIRGGDALKWRVGLGKMSIVGLVNETMMFLLC